VFTTSTNEMDITEWDSQRLHTEKEYGYMYKTVTVDTVLYAESFLILDYHIQVHIFVNDFGSTIPQAHPEGRDRVSSCNIRKPSHLGVDVCLRKFH
jgi:hypothetical protein